eukprot:2022257-Rhodomonas_salina.2
MTLFTYKVRSRVCRWVSAVSCCARVTRDGPRAGAVPGAHAPEPRQPREREHEQDVRLRGRGHLQVWEVRRLPRLLVCACALSRALLLLCALDLSHSEAGPSAALALCCARTLRRARELVAVLLQRQAEESAWLWVVALCREVS